MSYPDADMKDQVENVDDDDESVQLLERNVDLFKVRVTLVHENLERLRENPDRLELQTDRLKIWVQDVGASPDEPEVLMSYTSETAVRFRSFGELLSDADRPLDEIDILKDL